MPDDLEPTAGSFEALDALLLTAETACHVRTAWEVRGDLRRVTATGASALSTWPTVAKGRRLWDCGAWDGAYS